jgi:uncharacterized protein YbjT (DUF2867 family)
MNLNKRAVIFGASGLVGKALVDLLIENEKYSKIIVANRREIGYSSSKVDEKIIDFSKLKSFPDLFDADEIFICLGTTINKAGSKAAFEHVDLELPTEIAMLAEQGNANQVIMISSLGADKNASSFYLSTKGKAEKALLDRSTTTYIVRPSMLFGDRSELRIGESIGKFFIKIVGPLMVGRLKKYKGIYADEVAKSMIYILNKNPSESVIESNELKKFAELYDDQNEAK